VAGTRGGGGFAEADQSRHQLIVCDTSENGRSVTADYPLEGNDDVQHRTDDNGAQPGCGETRVGDVLIRTVRVCDSDAGKDPECTDWEQIKAGGSGSRSRRRSG
jgi:hypothetical protein